MTRFLKYCAKHIKILPILKMLLTISVNFFLFGICDATLLDNGTLIGVHNGKLDLELSSLTKSLILASSPFMNLSDKSKSADGNPNSKQLIFQNDNHVVPILVGSPSDPLRGSENKDDTNDLGNIRADDSRIHEVRVKPPFSVTKSQDRNGKSLYSPGPTTDRKEFDYAYEEPLYRDTEPRFLKKTIESLSHFFTQSFAKHEPKENHLQNGDNFKPVTGTEKVFPPQMEVSTTTSNGSFSQPINSGSSTSSWKPSHRLEKVTDDIDDNQKKDDSISLNKIKKEKNRKNHLKKEELARLNMLLNRQKLIKEQYLKTLGATQNPKTNYTELEEGTPPSKDKIVEKEIKAERYTDQSSILEKPFIGTYDIADEGVKEEQFSRGKRKNLENEHNNMFQDDTNSGQQSGIKDSQVLEDQSRSENTLVPIYVSTAQPHVHNHEHRQALFAVNSNQHQNSHRNKLSTVLFNDFHTDTDYLTALANFRSEYARKNPLSKANLNRDIRLEIPITLDAKISIPEHQREFGELFKDYTPRFVLRDDAAKYHIHKAHDESHKYSMSKANHPKPKPQNQKKNYKASLQPQTNGNAYLLPQENFQTLYGMASLDDTEIQNKQSSSYDAPHLKHMQPPTLLYQTPKTETTTKKALSSLYNLPHETLGSLYETSRNPLSLFEALQKMAPPNRLYEIPEISHTGYGALIGPTNNPINLLDASSSLYDAPSNQNEKGYKPPKGYDYTPPKGYEASHNPTFPKILYEEPKEDYKTSIKTPKGYDYAPPQGYDASENPTFPKTLYGAPNLLQKKELKDENPKALYETPKSAYKPPEGYDYKAPKGYKAEKNPTFPKTSYEAPKVSSDHKRPTSFYDTPKGNNPPEGYDYKAPKGYKAESNPTFPKKLYEAPDVSIEYQPPSSSYNSPSKGYSPPKGYDYKVPQGYKADKNPTFPNKLYEAPEVKHKPSSSYESPPKGYSPPEGYDYKAPEGYKAGNNPTFPKELYKVPEVSMDYKSPLPKGYSPPEGYDYKAPKGYKAENNPTFPNKLYEAPEPSNENKLPLSSHDSPQNGYSSPEGYDYKAPDGYKASENPTFPKNLVETKYGPPEAPQAAYSPPTGYDYKAPEGYKPDENPTFPSKSPKNIESVYKPPKGYDYTVPIGYKAAENPTFPKTAYQAPQVQHKEKSNAVSSYKPAIDTGYTPPGKDHSHTQMPRKSHKRKKKPTKGSSTTGGKTPDEYNVAENPTKSLQETSDSYKPPAGYSYSAPKGYEPSSNPTFPKNIYQLPEKDSVKGYAPPKGYDYSPPENYDPADNPTFPRKQQQNSRYRAPQKGYTYNPPVNYDPSINPTFPKHRFNIIIKNEDKADTELLISPQSGYAPPELIYSPPDSNYKSNQMKEVNDINNLYELPKSHVIDKKSGPNYNPDYNPTFPNHKLHNGQPNAKSANSEQEEYNIEDKYNVPTGLAKLALNSYENKKENAAIVLNAPKNLYETPGNVESEKSTGTHSHLLKHLETKERGYKDENPKTNIEGPGKYRTTSEHTNKVSPPPYQTPDTLYRIDLKNQVQDEKVQHDVDFVVDTKAKTVTRHHKNMSKLYETPKSLEDLPLMKKANQQHSKKILADLLKGTEQLLFSFVVPATFVSTDNIIELQTLVTQGCNKLQRKLLFADSLAKLPYKIGAIRGILTNLVNALTELQEENKTHILPKDVVQVSSIFTELQKSTHGLCRGQASLPVLAVDLQKSCDLLQDAKVVTIFNMIAVPCFVYQGAVGLLGERLQYIIEE